ncbi:hypothetical protein OR214_04163 [Ralstonia pickettii OR214]|jgi:hypothetical protein|uniref:Uncharacterized protein n=1 Tax=Ralstonia pickettii OR214 TaxID=1264675 RepID=R0CGP7_RALPI|nr:hypothetical protein OR214_04163 [Ralstonia pickettii OR214]
MHESAAEAPAWSETLFRDTLERVGVDHHRVRPRPLALAICGLVQHHVPDRLQSAFTQHAGNRAHHVALRRRPGEREALVLVSGAPQPRDLDPLDVETLLALQLIALERLSPGVSEPRITLQGHALLKALGVLRARKAC